METVSRFQLADHIRESARELGFPLCGVLSIEAYRKGIEEDRAYFQSWLAEGCHASMGYLERGFDRRFAPDWLNEFKSMVVVASPCRVTSDRSTEVDRPWIAQYAIGEDYHDTIPKRLEILAKTIASLIEEPIRYRAVTDTAAILERRAGSLAGLGWIGKNTCLINRAVGSYFLIGELLLSIEIPSNPTEVTDYCGRCRRCVEACPTQALTERSLDARKCISYWTIEHRGELPDTVKPAIQNNLFGCDICQEVCPWNRSTERLTGAPELSYESLATRPTTILDRLLQKSALRRAKREGLERNAAVVMENRRLAHLDPLQGCARDPTD